MNWHSFLRSEAEKDYFREIIAKVQEDAQKFLIFPPRKDLFNAFKFSPLEKTKVVLLGQDPYISVGQAHGLSFSVPIGTAIPPSLRNIFKELKDDLGIEPPKSGCLTAWASQGVLLLNSSLSVRQEQSGSHSSFGWQVLTNGVISLLNQQERPIVFILWGAYAKAKRPLITNDRHPILQGAHPSPLSANQGGFFGGKYFSRCNDFLRQSAQQPIDWAL